MTVSERLLLNLWSQSPLSWAIIRKTEIELLQLQQFKPPILEVGCGDGLVSNFIFKQNKGAIDVGIDLDKRELARAYETKIYKRLLSADITNPPFRQASFTTVFANGVLEHIPSLDRALKEISRLLKKNGRLVTTSPTSEYSRQLFYFRLFSSFGMTALASDYSQKINEIFKHRHLYTHQIWAQKFKKAGFKLVDFHYYNNPFTIAIHDICLPFAFATKMLKAGTDQMVLFPNLRRILFSPFVHPLNQIIERQSSIRHASSILLIAEKM